MSLISHDLLHSRSYRKGAQNLPCVAGMCAEESRSKHQGAKRRQEDGKVGDPPANFALKATGGETAALSTRC